MLARGKKAIQVVDGAGVEEGAGNRMNAPWIPLIRRLMPHVLLARTNPRGNRIIVFRSQFICHSSTLPLLETLA